MAQLCSVKVIVSMLINNLCFFLNCPLRACFVSSKFGMKPHLMINSGLVVDWGAARLGAVSSVKQPFFIHCLLGKAVSTLSSTCLKPGSAGTSLVRLPIAALYSWPSLACSRRQSKLLACLTAQQGARKMTQAASDPGCSGPGGMCSVSLYPG